MNEREKAALLRLFNDYCFKNRANKSVFDCLKVFLDVLLSAADRTNTEIYLDAMYPIGEE